MARYTFDPEEGRTIRTEDLCSRVGGCVRCPGIAKAKEVGMIEDDPDELIFCTHGCHLVSQ